MKTTLLGIDVGSKELVTARRGSDRSPLLKTFPNTPAGRRQLLESLPSPKDPDRKIRVCLEATGSYSLEIALLLASVPGCEVMVSNPITIKSFLRARGLRAKTDRIDAAGILAFLETMEFRPWTPPKASHLQLQATARRIYQLNAEKTREENRLEALAVSGITSAAASPASSAASSPWKKPPWTSSTTTPNSFAAST
jgi:transposase